MYIVVFLLCHLSFHSYPFDREEKRHAEVLQLQMAEIKRREEEAAMMEQERAMLVKEQVELERIVSGLAAKLIEFRVDLSVLHGRRKREVNLKLKENGLNWGEFCV